MLEVHHCVLEQYHIDDTILEAVRVKALQVPSDKEALAKINAQRRWAKVRMWWLAVAAPREAERRKSGKVPSAGRAQGASQKMRAMASRVSDGGDHVEGLQGNTRTHTR